ncbi:MAG: PEP-CTERM sorting domain-containing protein [Planctomycetota bacterium]
MQTERIARIAGGARRAGRPALCTAAAVAALGYAASSEAGAFVIADGNASAVFEELGLGLTSWEIDGTDHLGLQGFWFREQGGNVEVPLSNLGLLGITTTDTDPVIAGVSDDRDDTLVAVYGDANDLTFTVRLSLDGGLPGSGASDLAEQISIDNRGDTTRSFSFFQYVDFNLSGDGTDDFAFLQNANTVLQEDAFTSVAETVVTPSPDFAEIRPVPDTLNELQDNNADNLEVALAGLDSFVPIGFQGDVSWAFQWDVELAPGETFQISKDKRLQVVPEPGSVALLTAASGLLLSRRRRRRPGA